MIVRAVADCIGDAGVVMSDKNYRVIITMSDDTVRDLAGSGFYLYAFKAVRSSDQAGRPLVWSRRRNYSLNTVIEWPAQYEVYTSNSPIEPNQQVFVGFSTEVELGQTLNVEQSGIGVVTIDGSPGNISIFNLTNSQFTCGISQMDDGAVNPVCAFPLYGGNLQLITPLEKVLLVFSTLLLSTGTVMQSGYSLDIPDPDDSMIAAAISPCILIDLTNAPDDERKVSYDINDGWHWNEFTWASEFPPNEDIVQLLIEPPEN